MHSSRPHWSCSLALAAAGLLLHGSGSVFAADCNDTSVALTPINDLGPGLYLNQFSGGLYPNGLNLMPPAHRSAGIQRALSIQPRNVLGQPDPAGKYVLVSIGMSNTTQEWCGGAQPNCAPYSFMGQAAAHPDVNHAELVIVDGAAGGQTAGTWDDPTDLNYDRVRDQVLTPAGLSEAQVAAAWVKVANAGPQASLPAANADAFTLLAQMGDIARALRARYPNIRVVFYSSRIYAGYATTQLNPEPYAYESAFAVKWVVQAQITQMAGGPPDPLAGDLDITTAAPWIAWGPYLWADGLAGRSDGLVWQCADLANDGTHPSPSGREKVATMLMQFFLNSPHATPWFTSAGGVPCPADVDGDGIVGQSDLGELLSHFGQSVAPYTQGDLNGDGVVNQVDLGGLLANFGATCPPG